MAFLSDYREEHRQERAYVTNTDDEATRKEVERRCISPTATASCIETIRNADEAKKHERADLKAQQDTAEWTFASFLANVAGLFISAGGLWALFYTFLEQRKLTQNQSRAFIEGIGAAITYSTYRAYGATEHNISVQIHVQNTGQTPAFEVTSELYSTYSPQLVEGTPVNGEKVETEKMSGGSSITVSAHGRGIIYDNIQIRPWLGRLTESGSEGWIGTETCEPVTLVVFGVVRYRDVFGRKHTETVRFTINHLEDGKTFHMWGSRREFLLEVLEKQNKSGE
jgi:hypothetical protein